ncbi:MAG: thrombospondin N-terminal-like domain protein, partial [Pedosphaera sp.]|nr:thrombospondin N-terminal-like domain protein [Pedosphaera sp.]
MHTRLFSLLVSVFVLSTAIREASADTNCCANCAQPYPLSYTNIIHPGQNFVADNLCQGTNNTLDEVLGNVPDGTVFYAWNPATQTYNSPQTYYAGAGWYDDSGNSSTHTLSPGEGFVLQNTSGTPFPLVIRGCNPTCPPPCAPTANGLSLVGRLGLGTAKWTDLFSCPPPCGARMLIWNGSGFTSYDYLNGAWTPQEPVLALGQSAFVSVVPNTGCLPCTNNLVVNGSFEVTSPAVPPNTPANTLSPATGVPGWTTTAGNTLEVWGNTVNGLPASVGTNHMEINARSNDQTVSQVVTNLSTNCLATFCFDYTGRFGLSGSTYNNDFTITLSGGYSLSAPLDPVIYGVGGWTNFCVSFVPTSSTITIAFRGNPHFNGGVATEGGAHIDNVSLTQCCPTNPCITMACATNKTVDCGVNWKFDAPLNIVDTCCTNFAITFSAVTNSGPCPLVVTGTWLVSDACGNSNTCSQTVTVVDTTPPTLTCATNKTVLCGATWTFDAPVATDTCSGTSVTLTFTTVTNGLCPELITRTWTATDACGNANTCSQTVTVAACVTPPSGMVLWLPFDETSGTTSVNLAGGNNGAQIGGPSVNLGGYVANSLCFDGVKNYVEVTDHPAINIGTNDFSVDAWVKPATFDSTLRIIVDHRAEAGNVIGYSLFLGGGNTIGFQIGDGASFVNYPSTFTVPADGQWHQVAVTVKRNDPKGIHFFLDGVVGALGRDPTGQPGSITPPANYPLRVGSRSSTVSGLFPGCIDEVEVFNRELGTNEVQGLFNAGSAGKCKSSSLACATNKVVQCGSDWTFDPPVAATPCSGTTSAIIILGTVTNGVCPMVVTRTWQVVDGCERTNTCSQTVTMVDTTPPVITCPTNMIVMSCSQTGVVVHYTATATDSCCTNITLSSIPPSGSVFLPGNTTVSCTATDCCGNVSTCGFTVTVKVVKDTTPPIFTTYCTTNRYIVGGNNFTAAVAASPSANLVTRLQTAGVTCFKNFDVCSVNCYLAHTFTNLPPCITAATLTVRLKPCGDICGNDSINLSFTGAGGTLLSNSWTRYLGAGNPQAGLLPNGWCSYGTAQVITLDLANLPQAVGPALNDLPALNANGFLDFNCQDDSGVDSITLDIVSCCCATNKTVPYGTPWSFDQPSALDVIWRTNVTITSSTVTNSLCPLVLTRTWIATDPCGNSSVCSQTVTVGQSGPCQIFNTGMSGTNGNLPVASGVADPNFVLVSSPGAGTSCVVEGTLAGPWLPNSTTSEWVGPTSNTSASPAGVYHYQLVFILCCTNNAQMNGRLLVDDTAGLYLNGNPAGTAASYATFAPVNITSGFVSGVNVLDIYVTNAIIYTGFRAELTNCASGLVVACPKSIVVDCGMRWDFNPPVASSCCSSNVTITVTGGSTNGVCPKTATRTWRITDGCGNTNFCTQTITIRDTAPPVVDCPRKGFVVAFDKNCNLVIPLIQPPAYDNCTPPSQLVFTQNPPAGAVRPGPCQTVTLTVTDLCGNVTTCHVSVCGLDKTPPKVAYQKVITVTNCIVPNVLPFVSANDNCTPGNQLVFT